MEISKTLTYIIFTYIVIFFSTIITSIYASTSVFFMLCWMLYCMLSLYVKIINYKNNPVSQTRHSLLFSEFSVKSNLNHVSH